MQIRAASFYTASSIPNIPPRRGQAAADATATVAASVATVADRVTISQATRDRAAEDVKSGDTYDFTNMSRVEFGKLVADGKIADGFRFMGMTDPEFEVIMQAHFHGLTGTALEDAMNVASNTPVNFLQYYERGIRIGKMYGIDTTGIESILSQMQALQVAR